MKWHFLLVLIFSLSVMSCGAENSDGSDAKTYSSCSITDSGALLASDRAKDISQCWDGVNYKEKSLATSWCAGKVSSYIKSQYVVGHTVEYIIASTNCPSNNVPVTVTPPVTPVTPVTPTEPITYIVTVKVNSKKSNGSSWDILGGDPDIEVTLEGKYKKTCSNTYICIVEHTSNKKEWPIILIDSDLVSNDKIGSGNCKISDDCIIGQATVKILKK